MKQAHNIVDLIEPLDTGKSPNTPPPTIYECGFCKKHFDTLAIVNTHIDQNHGISKDQSIFCRICSAEFLEASDYTTHMHTVHKCQTKHENMPVKDETIDKCKQELKELVERLHNFDWCDCSRCVSFCQLFLRHLNACHVSSAFAQQTANEPTIGQQQPLPETSAINVNDYSYEETVEQEQLPESSTINADDYFQNPEINFALPKPKTEPAPVFVEPRLTNCPKMENTKKKVFFIIRKKGDTKVYICTVCKRSIKDHAQMLGHFKAHLKNKDIGAKMKNTKVLRESKNDVKGDLNIKATILGPQLQPVKRVMQYQCSMCAEISGSRVETLNCLRKHVDNGWPVDLDIEVICKNLSKGNQVSLKIKKK
jgi:hypothetical protein